MNIGKYASGNLQPPPIKKKNKVIKRFFVSLIIKLFMLQTKFSLKTKIVLWLKNKQRKNEKQY